MTKCRSCDKELLMTWPDTPWKCAFCATECWLCIDCYVEHTSSRHFKQLCPSVGEKARKR